VGSAWSSPGSAPPEATRSGWAAATSLPAAGPLRTWATACCQLRWTSPDTDGLAAAAADVDHAVGRVDVLVNNAAIHYDTWQNAVDVDLAVVREALETNVLGAWQATLAFLPLLRRSAHPRVVMVSSEGGSLASMNGGVPAYAVSKAALNALTRTLAGDLRRHRVLVNAVCPGWTATEMGGRGGRPVAEGAASILWAADLPDGCPTGTFTRDGRPLRW
jgi:NAD(P)-dependent dehydrogenase (short-subunit alcohol dehydrogenase family)